MSIFSSLLSPGLTAATTAVGAYQRASATKKALEQQQANHDAIQRRQQSREDEQDEQRSLLTAATMQNHKDLALSRATDDARLDKKVEDDFLLGGGVRGGTTVTTEEPEAPPPPPTIANRLSDPNGLSPSPPAPPSLLTTPVKEIIGSVPKVRVEQTPDRWEPSGDRVFARTQAGINARGVEGAANRGSRERVAGNAVQGRAAEGAANRDARATLARDNRTAALGKLGERAILPETRLNNVMRLLATYMTPVAEGGIGLDATAARARAVKDVDAIIASQRRGSGGPSDAGVDADSAVDAAVKLLKEGKATLGQLDASKESAAFKAEVKRRAGAAAPPPVVAPAP